MQCLALNILDIVQNSIRANAEEINITVNIDENFIKFIVEDDGDGMTKEETCLAKNPFFTSKEKKVGLGLALLEEQTKDCDGSLTIETLKPKGLKVIAIFERNHINSVPLGDIAEIVTNLTVMEESIHIILKYIYYKEKIIFDSQCLQDELKENNNDYSIIMREKKFLLDKIKVLNGGIDI